MSAVDPLDVLALLEEKPYTEAELRALFGTSSQILTFTLKALKRDGQVRQLADRRWTLAPAPTAPVVDRRAPVDSLDEDLDEDLAEAIDAKAIAIDDPADVDEENAPAPPAKYQRPDYPIGTRQGATKKAPPSNEPGWWVRFAAPDQRDAFQSAAAARNDEMREKSPAWRSQTRPNNV